MSRNKMFLLSAPCLTKVGSIHAIWFGQVNEKWKNSVWFKSFISHSPDQIRSESSGSSNKNQGCCLTKLLCKYCHQTMMISKVVRSSLKLWLKQLLRQRQTVSNKGVVLQYSMPHLKYISISWSIKCMTRPYLLSLLVLQSNFKGHNVEQNLF